MFGFLGKKSYDWPIYIHEKFKSSSFKMENLINHPICHLNPPSFKGEWLLILCYFAKKSYKWPRCMYANFQVSSFKMKNFKH